MWMRRSPNDMLQRTSDASETSDRSYHTPGAFVRAISAKIAFERASLLRRALGRNSSPASLRIFAPS